MELSTIWRVDYIMIITIALRVHMTEYTVNLCLDVLMINTTCVDHYTLTPRVCAQLVTSTMQLFAGGVSHATAVTAVPGRLKRA